MAFFQKNLKKHPKTHKIAYFPCVYQKFVVPLQPKIIIMYYGNFVSLTKSNSLVPYANHIHTYNGDPDGC